MVSCWLEDDNRTGAQCRHVATDVWCHRELPWGLTQLVTQVVTINHDGTVAMLDGKLEWSVGVTRFSGFFFNELMRLDQMTSFPIEFVWVGDR